MLILILALAVTVIIALYSIVYTEQYSNGKNIAYYLAAIGSPNLETKLQILEHNLYKYTQY